MTLESHRYLILFKGIARRKIIHVNKIFLEQRVLYRDSLYFFCENVIEKHLFSSIRKYHPSSPSSHQLWETCMEGRYSQTGFFFLNTNLCPTENAPSGVLIYCDLDGVFFSS